MELVYLWVEDYKNIHKQGFNFSPKFNCDYDEDTNELTIDENDDYIENFFGDNINVTAIVGKNGSGKSSVLESIKKINETYNGKRYILLSNSDRGFHSYSNINSLISNKKVSTLSQINLLSTGILDDKNIKENINLLTLSGNHIDTLFLIKNSKYFYVKKSPNIFIPKYIVAYYKDNDFIEKLEECYKFNTIRFIFHEWEKHEKNEFNNFSDKLKSELDICNPHIKNIILHKYKMISNIEDKVINALKVVKKYKISSKELLYMRPESTIIYIDIPINNKEDIEALEIFHNLYDEKNDLLPTNKEYLPIFDLDLLDSRTNSTYSSISDGERSFTRMLIESFRDKGAGHINNVRLHNLINLYDEVENFMHPNWQKKYFNTLITYFKITKKPIHLIFTTHSPFLLSDIPKQNIIFLDKDENGNCKVLKHDEVMNKKQTFGANIHTLLSDSFFMKGGLMGEFAKGKINEIIEFHKETEKEGANINALTSAYQSKKDKFWQTQSIVGDEYLKQVLKNHLIEIEKILLGKDKAKENEIKRTEAYLESLKNG